MTRAGFFAMAGAFIGFLFGMFFPYLTASIAAIVGGLSGFALGLLADKAAARNDSAEHDGSESD